MERKPKALGKAASKRFHAIQINPKDLLNKCFSNLLNLFFLGVGVCFLGCLGVIFCGCLGVFWRYFCSILGGFSGGKHNGKHKYKTDLNKHFWYLIRDFLDRSLGLPPSSTQ